MRRLAALGILLFISLSPCLAQLPPPGNKLSAPAAADPSAAPAEHGPSALPYVVALLSGMLVLYIVCMPSRKG